MSLSVQNNTQIWNQYPCILNSPLHVWGQKKNMDIPFPCKLLLISFDLITTDNYKIFLITDNYKILFTINPSQKSDLNNFSSIKYIFFLRNSSTNWWFNNYLTYPRYNLWLNFLSVYKNCSTYHLYHIEFCNLKLHQTSVKRNKVKTVKW